MSIVVQFDDDEIREYSGDSRKDCISQAKKRCEKISTDICCIIDCYGDSED
jgi:hypothetical protein